MPQRSEGHNMTRLEIIEILKGKGIKHAFDAAGFPSGPAVGKLRLAELIEQFEKVSDREKIWKPHYSYSAVNQYQKCPMQYYFRRELKLLIPPPGIVIQGSAFDDAANHNYTAKLKSGQDEPLSVLQDVFMESLKERKDGADWTDQKVNFKDIQTQGLQIVNLFRNYLSPKTIPLEVQKAYRIDFGERNYEFIGYADLIADSEYADRRSGAMIIDHKVTGRMPSEDWVRLHPQLDAYAACYAVENGKEPLVAIDALVRGKKAPDAARIFAVRTPETSRRWWNTVHAVAKAIEAGIFFPTPKVIGGQTNWVCTPAYCGYWQRCHEQFDA